MGTKTTWVIYTIVLGLAVSSVLSVRGPQLPGTLRLGVLRGPGPQELEASLAPFARYLGESVRRTVAVEVLTTEDVAAETPRFDVAILPASLVVDRDDLVVLAWAKPAGLSGWRTRSFVVQSRGTKAQPPRVVVGDSLSWAGARDVLESLSRRPDVGPAAVASAVFGRDLYDHCEVLSATSHGAYDICVAREGDLRRALASGLIDPERFEFEALGRPHAGFALVATTSLSKSARGKLRGSALNLDHFRFDRANRRAETVLQALARLGLNGFAPVEVLPGLRP